MADGLTELKGATAPRLLLELICARVLLPGADHGTDGIAGPPRPDREADVDRGHPDASSGARARRHAPALEPPRRAPRPPRAEIRRADAGPSRRSADAVESRAETPARPGERPSPSPTSRRPNRSRAGRRPPAASSTGLTLVDVRRLWPDLLEAVKLKRRFTWILLSQHAQVADVDDKTLTIALVNAGARNSFTSGGSEEILRQAAIDVIGHDWRVESIVDPSAQPGHRAPSTARQPAAGRRGEPGRPSRGSARPRAIAGARGAIQDTGPAGAPRRPPAPTRRRSRRRGRR